MCILFLNYINKKLSLICIRFFYIVSYIGTIIMSGYIFSYYLDYTSKSAYDYLHAGSVYIII